LRAPEANSRPLCNTTNQFLHVRLFQSQNAGQTYIFLAELREKHPVEDAVFLVDGVSDFTPLSIVTASIPNGLPTEIGIASNECFRNSSAELRPLAPTSDTPHPLPLKHSCNRLLSASTSISEHIPDRHARLF
jgi:hypothetical protein